LPFRFLPLKDDKYVATNEVGQYVVMNRADLQSFTDHTLQPETALFKTLKARHFLFDDGSRAAIDLLALKYRTRAERLSWLTGLHIFVVTLRCDHSCHYCQVSRQTEDRVNFDMTRSHADKALEFAFRSPSPNIKLEFQGGEPLLNFELIRYVVERAEQLNVAAAKNLAFVIASNLSRLTAEILAFCREHGIYLSTSLDGPEDIHEAQRPLRDGHSYATTIDSIQRARAALGHDAVSALMTTTPASLGRVEEIVDEYKRQGFGSIFLRNLSPYGFAARSLIRRYDVDDWVAFYKRGLARVLELNRRGYPMREELTSILLQKMFSPSGASYVDLQSPAGIGIGAIVYNYDGAIYASDEGRMLAEMDDDSFRLGHLDSDSFQSVMTSETLLSALSDSMAEGAPMCSDCAFLPYCGADPVFHKATQGDVVGHKAFSAFCKRQMALLRHLISLLEDDADSREILLGWV
jgi:His-Xaa-Ser system radical SAM maturase HxsB